MASERKCDMGALAAAWRQLVTRDPQVGGNYLHHLVKRIMVHENRIVLVPRLVHSSATGKT